MKGRLKRGKEQSAKSLSPVVTGRQSWRSNQEKGLDMHFKRLTFLHCVYAMNGHITVVPSLSALSLCSPGTSGEKIDVLGGGVPRFRK